MAARVVILLLGGLLGFYTVESSVKLSLDYFSKSTFHQAFLAVQEEQDAIEESEFLNTLNECRTAAPPLSDLSKDSMKKACNLANYVAEAFQKQQYILQSSSPSSKVLSSPSEEISSYEEMYRQVIRQNIPLVLDHESVIPKDATYIKSCFPNGVLAPNACKDTVDSVLNIPVTGLNNYLVRINTNDDDDNTLHSDLYSIKLVQPSTIVSCPYGSHMNLWSAPQSETLNINLVPIEDLDELLQDFKSFNPLELHSITTMKYNSRKKETIVTIQGGKQALFIPSGYVAIVLSTDENIFQQCFVDASNYNDFLSQLSVAALVNPSPLSIKDITSTSMDRRPNDSSSLFTEYQTWPKVVVKTKKKTTRQERFKLWQEENKWERLIEADTLPVVLPPIVDEVKRTSVTLTCQDSYRISQDDTASFGYIISWYETHDLPITYRTLSIKEAQQQQMRVQVQDMKQSTLPTSRFGDDFDGYELSVTTESILKPNTSYCFTIRPFLGKDTVGVESLCSTYVSTLPVTVPSVVPGIPSVIEVPVQHPSEGVLLSWKPPVDDGGIPLTSYVVAQREILPSDLEAYRRIRSTSDSLNTQHYSHMTVVNGTTNRIFNLVSNRKYVFRVAGVNDFGIGKWSVESDVVVTPEDTLFITHVVGKGHESYQETVSINDNLLLSRKRKLQDIVLPVATLSDVFQKLILNSKELEVWASHFSPKHFNVTSEIVRVQPTDASSDIENDVRDRIAVAARGTVPFRTKALYAQAAGALALVITTDSDQCMNGFDQLCSPGADKSRGEGFAAHDNPELWSSIRIPVVLLRKEDAEFL